jgi:hypothetical protein
VSGIYRDVVPADTEAPETGLSISRPEVAPQKAEQQNPFAGKGYLLEADDVEVFETIHSLVKGQEPLAKNREAKDKHWSRVRRGIPFSTLTKDEDRSLWKAELPPGIDDRTQPIPNKADDLCRKMGAQVMVDPPIADPKPATDSDADRASAELSKKFLKADGDESGTNDTELLRAAIDIEMTKASAFAHVWVDMQGGGWRPKQIKAHPQAVDANNPMVGPDGALTADHILRYVTAQGQFTENPAEADRQWLPQHKVDALTHAHVRTVPATADVHSADSVVLIMCRPLSEAKQRFPDLAQVDDETLRILCDWRPLRPKAVVPPAFRSKLGQQDRDKGKGGVDDDTLVFWYQKYCEPSPNYPDGADIGVNGANGGYVLGRALLRDDIPLPSEPGAPQASRPLLRDIPVAQFRCLHDSEEGDPFGRPAIELFAGANEALAHMYGAVLEHLDILLHPNVYIAALSPVQSWQVNQRNGTPINVMSREDMPTFEQVNQLPSFTPQIIEQLNQDAQQSAQLGDTAAGLDVSTSQSGVAKQTVVQQAKVHLASISQNFWNGVKRYWRIKLQLAQAKLTVPQQVEFVGNDQAFKQQWFSGADFVGVKDVAVMAGSGTMMGPVEKQQYVGIAQQNQWMDPDEAAETGRSLMGDDLGLKPNPHLELIGRQLALWTDGPPQGFTPAGPAMDQMGQPMMDPNTGQPAMQPASHNPFEPRPTDEDPWVAKTRYRKLREFIATSEYSKHPPEWRALLDQEYQRMAYAAGVMTVRQQAEAQQQAQAQQAAMAGEQANRDDANKDKDRAQGAAEGQANRDAQIERTAIQASRPARAA